ncbi:MAG: hypothetical protein EOP04_28225 [Proteobacteria bacterium]|nr:MAG: hypothetical protein EOP04_28225 [Pseudomonadota bacterium]
MILYAERYHRLKIKGGLIGLNLVMGSKAHKMMGEKVVSEFLMIWNGVRWSSRESVLTVLPFILRAYQLTPMSHESLHRSLDELLEADGLRIKSGELRKIVSSRLNTCEAAKSESSEGKK